jgi:hypothetical protein
VRDVTPTSDEAAATVPKATYASFVTKNVAAPDSNSVAPELSVSSIGPGASAPGAPIFVLKSGMALSIGNFSYRDGRINYTLASGGSGVISTDEVDWTATTRVNSQRGVRVTLRGGHLNQGAPGM